jgi:phage recombination protein Bet
MTTPTKKALLAAQTTAESSRMPAEFSRDQIELLKRTICRGASDDELQLFLAQCRRTGLDPFAHQIFAVKRWDSREKREVMQTQISIDGFRLIAERSGKYAGQTEPQWCGHDGKWVNVWLGKEPPSAARVGVLRCDFREPCYAVARYGAYVQLKREGGPNAMWSRMPDVMLAKCAEALSLRKSFPQELSGIYTGDELPQGDSDADPSPVVIAAFDQAQPQADQEAPARPSPFEEMIGQFSKLKARLAPEEEIYYQVLAQFGARHANQFPDMSKARAAYRALLARVREVETARQSAEEAAMVDTVMEDVMPEEEAIP